MASCYPIPLSNISFNLSAGSECGEINIDFELYLFWIFLGVESLLIITANAMLCWLFFTQKRLRSKQNHFVLSLSVSDLLVGLTIIPCEYCAATKCTKDVTKNKLCEFFCGSLVSFNMLASTMNLILITLDRFYSIKKPFRYHETFTKRKIFMVLLLSWLTTFLLILVPFTWKQNINEATFELVYMETIFSFIVIVGIFLGICYYTIVRVIKEKLEEAKEKSSNPAGIKVCILITISFFICWAPMSITENLLRFCVFSPLQIMDAMNASYFILLLNPLLDPLMYAYYRRDFRKELSAWRNRQWKFIKNIHKFNNKNNNNNAPAINLLARSTMMVTKTFAEAEGNGYLQAGALRTSLLMSDHGLQKTAL